MTGRIDDCAMSIEHMAGTKLKLDQLVRNKSAVVMVFHTLVILVSSCNEMI